MAAGGTEFVIGVNGLTALGTEFTFSVAGGLTQMGNGRFDGSFDVGGIGRLTV
jgi:hypothetical protein